MKVSIITPTTGSSFLAECIESVRRQSYNNIEHIVVVDGVQRYETCRDIFSRASFPNGKTEHICILPYPTGINRYLGHRIYGASSFLVDGDYHIWLDDDNTIEPNHVETLVRCVSENNLDWAYSLRKIINHGNRFICLDDCESLGMWNSVLGQNDFFVDVNCFFVKKSIAVKISPLWFFYGQFREPGQPEVDRAISAVLLNKDNKLRYDCTREYTVNYRVGNTSLSVQAEFFLAGNEKMMQRYEGKLPWKTK